MKIKQINKVNKNKNLIQTVEKVLKNSPTNPKKYLLVQINPYYRNPKLSSKCHFLILTTEKVNILGFL